MGVELACFHLARMLDLDLDRYSQGENLSERLGDSNLMGHQALRDARMETRQDSAKRCTIS